MICSISNFREFNFNGDISYIKEFIYSYQRTTLEEKIELTKNKTNTYVFAYNGNLSEDLRDINNLYRARSNIKIMILDSSISAPIDGLEAPYFYAFGLADADSLEKLVALCERKVSDVYITGELGFKMSLAREIADRYQVNLRVVPNCPTISGFKPLVVSKEEALTSFWIRPEDLFKYEDYIDIVEFYAINNEQPTYYNIYFQDKKWEGNMSALTCGVLDLENATLISSFTEFRINCGKACLRNRCHACSRFAITADLILKNRLEIEIENKES